MKPVSSAPSNPRCPSPSTLPRPTAHFSSELCSRAPLRAAPSAPHVSPLVLRRRHHSHHRVHLCLRGLLPLRLQGGAQRASAPCAPRVPSSRASHAATALLCVCLCVPLPRDLPLRLRSRERAFVATRAVPTALPRRARPRAGLHCAERAGIHAGGHHDEVRPVHLLEWRRTVGQAPRRRCPGAARTAVCQGGAEGRRLGKGRGGGEGRRLGAEKAVRQVGAGGSSVRGSTPIHAPITHGSRLCSQFAAMQPIASC